MSVSTLSKSQQAYEWIREKIRTRAFEPGHRLVLSQLASQLDVSVVPVREAIRQLEAEGLVTFEPNVGARVTTLNREAYFHIMEAIAVLEGAATALSAPLLSDAKLDTADNINQQMRALLAHFDPVAFTKLNKQFHQEIFSSCPNLRLVELLYEEWERLEYFRVSTFRYVPNRAAESVEEHHKILQLIRAGADGDYLEKLARQHRMTTADRYRELLAQESTAKSPARMLATDSPVEALAAQVLTM